MPKCRTSSMKVWCPLSSTRKNGRVPSIVYDIIRERGGDVSDVSDEAMQVLIYVARHGLVLTPVVEDAYKTAQKTDRGVMEALGVQLATRADGVDPGRP